MREIEFASETGVWERRDYVIRLQSAGWQWMSKDAEYFIGGNFCFISGNALFIVGNGGFISAFPSLSAQSQLLSAVAAMLVENQAV
ncbi:hypothetical protein FZC79_21240 [Rossellomorea vietnamensis]|uniref:Uncharacterized protein n=1 Tax=Rossellomorea vietnamensis TaxID=218284 RepID=A0A5D4K6I7_9BACI|nr:hypothetical protein [Rossellomorea vietnamensis]TYR72852.1 hypothetical protein FZC79_21240 [Rossellomorea vietnamensis]